MVFIDTMRALNAKTIPREFLAEMKCDHPSNFERRDYVTVEHEAWDNRKDIGDFPLTVISNDYGPNAENEDERTSVEHQRGWFELSPPGRQVVVTSGHNVADNEPDVIVEAVLRVLEDGRRS
jgi:hypothetical protein